MFDIDRYAARLRTEAAEHYSINTDVPYMCGRKRREHGMPWSHAGLLTYRAQRLARLGYVDAARVVPERPTVENWPNIDH